MKAVDFEYVRAATVADATQALNADPGAVLINGGQTLMPLLAMRLARPTTLIDISRIDGLDYVVVDPDEVRIGATATQAKVLGDPAVREALPLLCQALSFVGHIQTRNRGTICGSLAFADPAAEMVLMAKMLEASVVLDAGTSKRTLNAGAFYSDAMGTTIGNGELLVEAAFPRRVGRISGIRWGWDFEEVSARRSDFAWVSVASLIGVDIQGNCRDIRVGIGGINPTPFVQINPESLMGAALTSDRVAQHWPNWLNDLHPTDSFHAPAAYKLEVARGLAKRVLMRAYERATNG